MKYFVCVSGLLAGIVWAADDSYINVDVVESILKSGSTTYRFKQ